MAIYLSDLKIDLTIKHYAQKEEPGDVVRIDRTKTPELELKEQNEFKNLTLREAMEKLIKYIF